jgi:hypothetical protein
MTISKLLIMGIIIICCFTFCQEKEQKEIAEEVSPSESYLEEFNNQKKVRNLLNKIVVNGDIVSYKELKNIYSYSNHGDDFLYYSLVMAENFKFSEAYFDAFIILKTDKIDSTNTKTNKLANYYLLKANERGVKEAKYFLNKRFGKISELPKSEEYWVMFQNK